MAKLSSINFKAKPKSIIIYGPPKSGKTTIVASLAKAGYRLWLVDLENGGETLTKLPLDVQELIEYFYIHDTVLAPNGITTALKLMTGAPVTFCQAHGKVGCGTCMSRKDSVMEKVEFNALTDKDIVVWDSLTQLTESANAFVALQHKVDIEGGKKFEFDHWNHQGVLLRKFLSLIQNAPWHNIVLSHEASLELEDGKEKVMPAGGTRNQSRNVAKYFGHAIYMDVVNRKHRAISSSTAENRILTGSRTDVVVDMSSEIPLLPFFQHVEKAEPATASAGAQVVDRMAAMKVKLANKS